MRVLHVLPTRASSYGGPNRVAEELARQLVSHGIESTLYPPAEVTPSARLMYYPGLKRSLDLFAAVRKADLVHVHGLWTVPTTAAATCARMTGKPYVVTPHGMLDRWAVRRSGTKKRIYAAVAEHRTLRRATALHFFNQEEADEAHEFTSVPAYFLLPNGVDLAAFENLPRRAALEAMVPDARGRTVALFLGRIHPKKGFDVLIPAMAEIAAPDLLLVVAGPDEGGYRAEVEALAAAHRVAGQVRFVGSVDGEAKRTMLGGADFFVLPSHQEGDSVAIKEALASSLPVLISDRCHFPEVAAEGAGVVVPDRVETTAEGLREMLRAEVLGARAAAARRLALRYDSGAIAARLARIYNAIAAGAELPAA